MKPRPALGESGFTLIDVLISLFILAFGMLALARVMAQSSLSEVEASQRSMYATLQRMPEHCEPFIYYHRVRPYIHGWKNHPDIPEGVIYEGVDAYRGRPH